MIKNLLLSAITFIPFFAAAQEIITSMADDASLVFGYCGDKVNYGVGVNSSSIKTIGGAIYIPEEIAEKWKGNSVTGVILGFGRSISPTVDIFISEGADYNDSDYLIMDTPVISQTAAIENQFDWNQVTLDQPYLVSGKPFYVGYTTRMLYGDRPIATDYAITDENGEEFGDFLGLNEEWMHRGSSFGQICLKIIVSGNSLPAYDVSISNLFVPEFVEQDKPFESNFVIKNNGTETIESVTVEMSADGYVFTTVTTVPETPIMPGNTSLLNADLACDILGTYMDITAKVVKINGSEDVTITDESASSIMSCSDISYYRNVLVEEFTGTWCPACPIGIVGLEYMKEHYGDQGFIAIAGHAADEMQSLSYYPVVEKYAEFYPSALVNRNYFFIPYAETLEEYFLQLKKNPSYAQVNLEAAYDEESDMINIEASSQFAFDIDDAAYALTFVLCQNGVGPYAQINGFAGNGAYETMGGWENMGSAVAWIYDEVAREAVSPFGIDNSVPSSIKKGQKYSFQTEIDTWLPLQDCYLVGILIDTDTGYVVNSTKVNIATEAGVESIVSEPKDGIYKVFNLQGVKVLETKDASAVSGLSKGIYIINGKKVLVK